MKKNCIALLLIFAIALCLSACGHKHTWGEWQVDVTPTCEHRGMEIRFCDKCGEEQTRSLDMVEHTTAPMPDVPATCSKEGSTGGTYCPMCGKIFTAGTPTAKANHTYTVESILTPATCSQKGTKKITCAQCDAFITQEYDMEPYPATEINKQALQYVGEIIVFDRKGNTLGVGTGFVYTADGKVITNYHVIDGAYSAQITINSQTYEIENVLATDSRIDLAVLSIDGSNLPHAKLCYEPMDVGSTVYAIGSSRGMTNTFSQGIITYFDRQVDGVSHIQHDASITNGNSGGPLVNAYGEVVGVNTWGIADSQNLNFAVFIKELENLTFGKAVPISEYHDSSLLAPRQYLKNWVTQNANYTDSDYIRYDEELFDDGDIYSFGLGYDYESKCVFVDLLVVFENGSEMYVSIDFDGLPNDYYYYANYENTSGISNETFGGLDAGAFSETSPLDYDYTEGGTLYEQMLLVEMYRNCLIYTVRWLDITMVENDMPYTIADLGFTQL
ncbi:MAG: trypsin-like peptidase domain-containing protein [Oscillospiraceae bacterium]|nr:trypsin-like peptidase domain-containing protein [Oscillospiraceae bacterium]